MNHLSDKGILSAYSEAVRHKLCADFIHMLREEIEKRGLLVSNKNIK